MDEFEGLKKSQAINSESVSTSLFLSSTSRANPLQEYLSTYQQETRTSVHQALKCNFGGLGIRLAIHILIWMKFALKIAEYTLALLQGCTPRCIKPLIQICDKCLCTRR